MKNKGKQIVITVLAIVSLIVITVAVSYSFFTYTREGTTENVIKSGSITFLYTEVSKVGRGIELSDAYPISDEEGKIQTGEGKVFDFKVTSTTSSSTSIPYEVTARKKADSTLDEEAVKVYLTEVDGEEKGILLDKYSNLEQTSVNVPSGTVEKTIYTGIVPANNSNYEKNFRLRMWIDSSIDFSPVKDESGNDIYPYNNKKFTLTVNVYANGKVVAGELNTDTTLASLELTGCTLEPAFDSSIEEYSCSVKNSVDTTIITGSATSNTTKISGLGTKSLSVGDNTFIIKTLAENGDEKTYTVKVNRKKVLQNISIFGKQFEVLDEEPTLTTTSLEAGDEDGLYKSTATNSGDATYYFRGNVENNYVSFAGQTWRIIRINEDGTIRLIMQDGINNNTSYKIYTSSYQGYTNMYYSNSKAVSYLKSWYDTNLSSYGDYIYESGSYCEQMKVHASTYNSGDSNAKLIADYIPDFRCSTDANSKGIITSSIGLISIDEALYAGAYYLKVNDNFYLATSSAMFTMSPAGIAKQNDNSSIWRIYNNRLTYGNGLDYGAVLKPVINLKSDVKATGSGTSSSPFIIQ